MICRNCKQEFEDGLKACPHCGEDYSKNNYYSKMLEHAMSQNTQSAEEIDKLRKKMHKEKKSKKKKTVFIVLAVLLIAAIACGGVYYYLSGGFNGKGDKILSAGFNGSTFSVYDENGNEIQTISGGRFTKTQYTPEGDKAHVITYNGFVSFENYDYANGLVKKEYSFDGTKNYIYKGYEYEYGDNGKPVSAMYDSNGTRGMVKYFYDEDGNNVSKKTYDFESTKKQEYDYDSVGRLIGAKKYDLSGSLISNKQYSYKSDGSVYLSSVNEIHEQDDNGKIKNYLLTVYNEDGTKAEASVNTPEGNKLKNIEFTYDGGRVASEKCKECDGTLISTTEYFYNEKGDVSCEKITANGNTTEKWYTYEYFEGGAKALKAMAPAEKSTDYVTYTTYDANGNILKDITSTSHVEYVYDADGHVVETSNYTPSAKLESRTETEYKNGMISKEVDYDADGAVTDERTFVCDGYGNPVTKVGGNASYTYINSYDERGNLIGTDTYKLSNNEEYEYTHGFVSKKTVYNDIGAFVSSVGFRVDKKGVVKDEYSYDADGNMVSHIKCKYDDEGRQVGLASFDEKSKENGSTKITYNDRQKIINLESKDKEGNIVYSIEYNYSDNKPSLVISGISGGETKEDFENKYSFDENGNLSEVSYSRGGKVVSKEGYSYTETGDVEKSESVRFNGKKEAKSKYKYEFAGVFLKKCEVSYPDGTKSKVEYGIDDDKKPYSVGEK